MTDCGTLLTFDFHSRRQIVGVGLLGRQLEVEAAVVGDEEDGLSIVAALRHAMRGVRNDNAYETRRGVTVISANACASSPVGFMDKAG